MFQSYFHAFRKAGIYAQTWASLLVMGLPSALPYSGILHPFEWRNRQLRDSRNCVFNVSIGRRRCNESRRVGSFIITNFLIKPLYSFSIDKQVIADARRIAGEPEDSSYIPSDPREFSNRIFHTCYMGTENSSAETRRRAKLLSQAIGRYIDIYDLAYTTIYRMKSTSTL